MPSKAFNNVVHELFDRNIKNLSLQRRPALKSLFAHSFRCYQEDEYDGIAVDTTDTNGNVPSESPIYACRFGDGEQYGHILVLANEDGKIALRDTRDRVDQTAIEGQQIHRNAVYEVCWVPGTSEFVSVSGDQTAAIVAVREDGSLEQVLSLVGHMRSIKSIHVNPFDPSVIATGGRDGTVIIWDKRCKPYFRADDISPAHHNQVLKTLASPSVRKASQSGSSANNSVTGVLFQQQHTLISSGASDGIIKIWDLRKTHSGGKRDPQCQNALLHSGKSSHRGFTCLSLSPSRDVLYTSCMDNVIYAYHLANPTTRPVAEYTGHINLTYFVKSCISPCGSYLLSGSSDNNAYIWLTDKPGMPIAKLTGHFAEVTSVGWCPVDDEKLVTCADDMKLRVFRRKNVDDENFEERMSTRGVSEPYFSGKEKECHSKQAKSEASPENPDKHVVVQEPKEALPPLPVTPSTSRANVSVPATPSSILSPQFSAATPKQQTPRHRHKGKGKVTPKTPQTGERNTLLQWLASAKTPGPKESSIDQSLSVSETKKANLKRKLTDLLNEDQENKEKSKEEKSSESKEEKSSGSSPRKVLVESSANTLESPQPTVAKMLKYEDDRLGVSKRDEMKEENTEMSDYVRPIEDGDKIILDNGFRKPVTNIANKLIDAGVPFRESSKSPESVVVISTPSKSLRFGHLSSPTANLPNYVLDGSSPHNRPETPKEKKKNPNWLTSFSYQRKLKFSALAQHEKTASPGRLLGPLAPPKRQKKVLQIKKKVGIGNM